MSLIAVFFGSQVGFLAWDLASLRADAGTPSWRELWRTRRGEYGFLAAIWLGYFALQTVLLLPAPSRDQLLAWASALLSVNLNGELEARWPEVPGLAALYLTSFFVISFWDYLVHRFVLHARLGWWLHEYHHVPSVLFVGMPGLSARPFVVATTALTYAATFFTLLPLFWVLGARQVQLFIAYLPWIFVMIGAVLSAGHSYALRKRPWAHRVLRALLITSPQEHVLHHGRELQGNFGNFSPLWDRLFGTYLPPRASEPPLGLAYDQDFLGAVTMGRLRFPQAWRERFNLGSTCNLTPANSAGTSSSSRVPPPSP